MILPSNDLYNKIYWIFIIWALYGHKSSRNSYKGQICFESVGDNGGGTLGANQLSMRAKPVPVAPAQYTSLFSNINVEYTS